jgi:hypothetical protein
MGLAADARHPVRSAVMDEARVPLAGIGVADDHLGCTVPLPSAPLPLARWVEVVAGGPGAVQVEWNLDDTRPGSPGRLTLCVSHQTPPERGLPDPTPLGRYAYRSAPLAQAESALRPVQELAWEQDGLHLRLTGQGPWEADELVALADSIS